MSCLGPQRNLMPIDETNPVRLSCPWTLPDFTFFSHVGIPPSEWSTTFFESSSPVGSSPRSLASQVGFDRRNEIREETQ